MPSLPQTDSRGLSRPTPSSLVRELRLFAAEWVRLNALDVLVILLIGGISFGIYLVPMISVRTFPITFNGSGDIIYPEWAYPYRGWILPSWLAGLLSIAGPILVYILAQFRVKSAWDASNAIMGTVWAVTLGCLFQVTIKQLIGGFRPYFLDVCMPDVSLAKTHNKTGLNGVGFQQVMYTTEICTQPSRSMLKNAVTSFPSGHSTAAFSGFIFLFLWLNAKLKVWADHKPAFWKLALTMAPMLSAVMIACSLTIDAAHNWYDIVGGSTIGTVMAVASYRSTYAAVLDWRFNHLPLQEKESFMYDAEEGSDIPAQTFTRSARWGESRRRLDEQYESASTSAFFAHHPGRLPQSDAEDNTSTEGSRPKQRYIVGDQAV